MRALDLFTKEVVIAGASAESEVIDLKAYAQEGYFSVQLAVTGDGTLKVEYELSNTGFDFVTQSASGDIIISGFTKLSGPGSDGKDIISFEPEPALRMRIKLTETGGADSVTVSTDLIVL